MPQRNSVNLFGTTPYIVSATGSQGSYLTIQAALTAASAATNGVVYVKPGIYFENLTFPANVTLIGAGAGFDNATIFGVTTTVIVGAHTVSVANSQLNVSNILFGPTVSATNPLFTFAPSSGTTYATFNNCVLDDSFNAANGAANIVFAPTSTGAVNATISNCLFNAANRNLSVGANSTVSVTMSTLTANQGGTTPCVLLTAATSVLNSSYNTYVESAFACVLFTAAGTMTSMFDSLLSNDTTGYFVRASGAFGSFSYGDAILRGTATSIDPQVTATLYYQSPDVIPRTNGQVAIGSTGAPPVVSTLTAGSGISIANGAGSITISTSGGGLGWSMVNTSFTMTANRGYVVTSGPGNNMTLPATSSLGDIISIVVSDPAAALSVRQAASQQIRFGLFTTTLGTGGSLTQADPGACLTLVCTTANTIWSVLNSVGNFTVV